MTTKLPHVFYQNKIYFLEDKKKELTQIKGMYACIILSEKHRDYSISRKEGHWKNGISKF